jgi:Fe-S cluster assembly iron-binding protein IscA
MLAVVERSGCRRALYAAYQFADLARLDAALESDGYKVLVAEFDQAWPHGVS